jgi:hypothetical protein
MEPAIRKFSTTVDYEVRISELLDRLGIKAGPGAEVSFSTAGSTETVIISVLEYQPVVTTN